MDRKVESAIADGEIPLKFKNEAEEKLFREARLGEEAFQFLNSDLGRLLNSFAEQERKDCAFALLTVPWWRWKKIQKLQNRAAVANQFIRFVYEVIVTGEVAYNNMQKLGEEQ